VDSWLGQLDDDEAFRLGERWAGWGSIPVFFPLYQGGWGSVWDPEPSRERVGDWGGPETVWALLCVAERRATATRESGV
jgi:hypothetical protein